MDSAVRSRYAAYLDSVNQQQRWTASRQRDVLRHALSAESFYEWSTGKGGPLLGLDPVQQVPISDHLPELVYILGSPSQIKKILTLEINGQVSIKNGRSYFPQRIEHFTNGLGPCFCAEDTSPLIDLIRCMTRLRTLDAQFSSCSSISDISFWALRHIL